jgi:hypothetical protein
VVIAVSCGVHYRFSHIYLHPAIACTTCSKYQISTDHPLPASASSVSAVRGVVAGSGCAQLTLSCASTATARVVYGDFTSNSPAGTVVVDCNSNAAWVVDGGTSIVIGYYCSEGAGPTPPTTATTPGATMTPMTTGWLVEIVCPVMFPLFSARTNDDDDSSNSSNRNSDRYTMYLHRYSWFMAKL